MSVLTDDEISGIAYDDDTSSGPVRFARAVEQAILSKLAEAEMPEPFIGVQYNQGWRSWQQVIPSAIGEERVVTCYTADQLRAYGAACAARMLSKEPVAWAWFDSDGDFRDGIRPAEHEWKEGKYTTPLYTRETP